MNPGETVKYLIIEKMDGSVWTATVNALLLEGSLFTLVYGDTL